MKQSNQKGGAGMTMRSLMLLILVVSAGVFLMKLIDYTELVRQKEALEQQKEQYIQEIEELTYRLDSPIDYEDIRRYGGVPVRCSQCSIQRSLLQVMFPSFRLRMRNIGCESRQKCISEKDGIM